MEPRAFIDSSFFFFYAVTSLYISYNPCRSDISVNDGQVSVELLCLANFLTVGLKLGERGRKRPVFGFASLACGHSDASQSACVGE